MSVENLKEYARRCAADPELRAKAKEIGMTDMDEHMRHAESLGLDWTMDDVAAFRKEVVDENEELADLTEGDMEQISGGVVTATAAAVSAVVAGSVAAIGVGAAAVGVGTAAAGGGVGNW